MPARYTPPVPHRPCAGNVWAWPAAVRQAVDATAVPGLTDTTVIVARALQYYADRDDGTTRPGLQHLAERTQLARRTLLLHISLLIDAGLLTRVERGRHTSLSELIRTGRGTNAAVYRLTLPTPQPATPTPPPPPAATPDPTGRPPRPPVHTCTPPRSITKDLETTDAREENAGLTAGGDPATTQAGCRARPNSRRRPPPAPGTRRWHRWQAAEDLRRAVPHVLRGCSTPALASAMRQGLAENWTTHDFVHLLQHRPLPALPDRLGGRAHIHHPAGLLAWRINDWFTQHGPLRPTAVHAEQIHQRRADDIRRRAADARDLAALRTATQNAATAEQAAAHAAGLRRRMGWTARPTHRWSPRARPDR